LANTFFTKILKIMVYNIPAVYDALPARIRLRSIASVGSRDYGWQNKLEQQRENGS
jgi:hypothetical protein